MLRDPVDRFISHYKQLIRDGVLKKDQYKTLDANAFGKAVEISPKLLDYGNYYRHLVKFIDVFGTERICVTLKEDVDRNPKNELEKVYGFLQVDPDYTPPILAKKVSTGIVPRFSLLESLRIKLFRKLNKSAPCLIVYTRQLRLPEMYRQLNADSRPDQFKINSDVIEKLRAYYRDEVHGIEGFLARQLDTWKNSVRVSELKVE
jgi:Sulfotransferase domain